MGDYYYLACSGCGWVGSDHGPPPPGCARPCPYMDCRGTQFVYLQAELQGVVRLLFSSVQQIALREYLRGMAER